MNGEKFVLTEMVLRVEGISRRMCAVQKEEISMPISRKLADNFSSRFDEEGIKLFFVGSGLKDNPESKVSV